MKTSVLYILASVVVLISFGVFGYSFIEGWSVAEAFYMTMITVTTTGYQEVQPLSHEGRMFTVFLLIGGVGTIAFTTHTFVQEILSMDLKKLRRQKMKSKMNRLSGHTIICGYGRMGKIICEEMVRSNVPFVVIDKSSDRFRNAPSSHLWLAGDATDDQLLLDAGVERAHVVACMVDNDADSLYLTLAARSLNPELRIISRINNESARLKILRAGANEIVQPISLSAKRVAEIVINPNAEFDVCSSRTIQISDDIKVEFQKLSLSSYPTYIGKCIEVLQKEQGLVVVGLIRSNDSVRPHPSGSEVLQVGDEVLVMRLPVSLFKPYLVA